MPNFQIVGFASSDRAPGFVGKVTYGSAGASASDLPVPLVLVGTKLSTGTAVNDTDVLQIFTADDADVYFGAGSELARMCYAALLYEGVVLYAAPVSEAGSAVAATVAVTFATNATSAGVYKFRLDGIPFEVGVANGDTPTAVALAFQAALQAIPRAPATCTPAAGVATVTRKSKGARGNQGSFVIDTSAGPTGMTATVTTGTAMSGTGRFRFTGGSLTEVPTNVLATLLPRSDLFCAIAQNDQTNLVGTNLWRDWATTKNGPLEGRPTFVQVAVNDSTQPTTLAQAINDQMFSLAWQKNGESHPSEVAASIGAMRATGFAADPGFNSAGLPVRGVAAQVNAADRFARALKVSCLQTGITPIDTTSDFRAVVVRGITTRSFNGATTVPDFSTFDWSDAQVPQFVRIALALYWTTVFQPNNPRNASDPAEGQPPRRPGVATPSLWNKTVYSLLKGFERGVNGSPPLLIDVDDLPPTSIYDTTAKRIMSLVPVRPSPGDYQIGVSIMQALYTTPS